LSSLRASSTTSAPQAAIARAVVEIGSTNDLKQGSLAAAVF
jgi:hypothetical protein